MAYIYNAVLNKNNDVTIVVVVDSALLLLCSKRILPIRIITRTYIIKCVAY